MTGVSFDLPPVAPVAEANLDRQGVADRVSGGGRRLLRRPVPARPTST